MNLHITMKKSLLASFLFFLISGCSSPLTPDFGQMSAKYANILEQYQINMIFQNILRSSENRPVSFLDMPTINGSGSITVTPSASGLFSGGIIPYNSSVNVIQGGLTTLTPSASLSLNNTFNFTQSSLDNALFWKGYLNELPIETVKYFEHNHIPKEVILSLVIDEIVLTRSNGDYLRLINNPLRPEHAEFQKHLYQLISYGFGAYLIDTSQKIGPVVNVNQIKERFGSTAFEVFKETGITLKQVSSLPTPTFQPMQISKKYKLCINNNKYENYVREEYGDGVFCEESLIDGELNSNPSKKKQAKLTVRIRSTNNIFEYLGQVVKAQQSEKPFIVTLPPSATTYNPPNGAQNQYALFVVNKNVQTPRPFATIEGLDGNVYSIPSENNGYSPLAIKLLAQFMSLQKIPGSIPASPSVLLK